MQRMSEGRGQNNSRDNVDNVADVDNAHDIGHKPRRDLNCDAAQIQRVMETRSQKIVVNCPALSVALYLSIS